MRLIFPQQRTTRRSFRHFLPLAIVAALLAPAPAYAQETAVTWRLLEATIGDVHLALESGTVTCQEVVQGYLDRIEAYDDRGPSIHAVQSVNPRAVEEAARLDAAFETGGFVGPLHCITVLVKDQVETEDMPTTYGSALFLDFIPQRDATIVTRLKEAGAIILGKATMGEFASSYVGSAFGICRNVYDLTRNPSGSSCGSGIGAAANFATVAVGEDTAGSIRGPAAHTNTVGLRPTTELVSRFGMMPASPARDALGPITRTVRDAAVLMDVLAGYDPNDPVTAYAVRRIPETYTAFLDTSGLEGARIGVIREPMNSRTEPQSEDYREVRAVIDEAVRAMEALGAEVVDSIHVPGLSELLGQTGYSNRETEAAVDAYLAQHPNAPLGSFREIAISEVVAPTRRGGLISALNRSTDEPAHLQSLVAREELRLALLHVMAEDSLDAFVYSTFDHSPTSIPADVLTNPDAEDGYNKGSNRALSPAAGFPAITVPAGLTTEGLPVGIEFLSRPFAEGVLFRLAYAYEQATRHRRPPETTPPLARPL